MFVNRDLSDFECSHSEGLGQDRLASGVSGPSPGVGPGSGGLGTGAPGMPSQSLMSGSGHLQAPTSTTPDGGVGTGMHPNFLSMEPHPSAMGPGDISIKQEISAGGYSPCECRYMHLVYGCICAFLHFGYRFCSTFGFRVSRTNSRI